MWIHRLVWLHAICTTEDIIACFLSLRALPTAEEYYLAELNHFAGLHFSPMKLGALHYICDGSMEVFHWLAKLPVRHHRPPPPTGGVPGTVTTTTFLLTVNIW